MPIAHITGFEDVDSSIQSMEVKDNGDLEQLKQRLPWNQLSTPNEIPTSSEALQPQPVSSQDCVS